MSPDVCWLVTLLYGDSLIRCALKVARSRLFGSVYEFPMEPENRAFIHTLLPEHVRSCGEIVEIQEIFEICEAS